MQQVAGFGAVLLVFVGIGSYEQIDEVYQKSSVFGLPVENLSPDLREEFDAGFQLFVRLWTPGDGLGPYFNARSCSSCHAEPVIAGSGTTADTLVIHSAGRSGIAAGIFQKYELTRQGHIVLRTAPRDSQLRKAPGLFGLGLLEAVSAGTLREYADPMDLDNDGVSGRIAGDAGVHGRFGWTGVAGTIEEFVALAFFSELGLASSSTIPRLGLQRSSEISDNIIRGVAAYIRMLAPPPAASLRDRFPDPR